MPNSATYEIQNGDTLSRIASRLGTTVEALARENGIDDPNRVRVGQVLKVPAAGQDSGARSEDNTGASAEDDWLAKIEKFGDAEAKAEFAAGKRVLLALRKPTNTKLNQGKGRYDDRLVIVQRKDGGIQAVEFACNTEPSRQYGWGGAKDDTGPDLNRDRRVDQGRLVPGTYHYESKPDGFLGAPAFKCRSNQTAERDINQDGDFNSLDGDRRIDPASAGRTMYIHRGGDDNTWSAGCQTIQKSAYNNFLRALGGQTSFSYILINADS